MRWLESSQGVLVKFSGRSLMLVASAMRRPTSRSDLWVFFASPRIPPTFGGIGASRCSRSAASSSWASLGRRSHMECADVRRSPGGLGSAVLAGARDGTANWDHVALNVFDASADGLVRRRPCVSNGQWKFSRAASGLVFRPAVAAYRSIASIAVRATSNRPAPEPDMSCILSPRPRPGLSDVSDDFGGAPSISLSGCSVARLTPALQQRPQRRWRRPIATPARPSAAATATYASRGSGYELREARHLDNTVAASRRGGGVRMGRRLDQESVRSRPSPGTPIPISLFGD